MEPKISSIYPAGGQRGQLLTQAPRVEYVARCVIFEGSGVEARILSGGEFFGSDHAEADA
jgi:hypothetical protein